MIGQPSARPPMSRSSDLTVLAIVVVAVVAFCSIYANLSFLVTDSKDYQFFPPFEPHVNMNMNDHLGAEYFNVAQALVAGEGFANPFEERTGPTAWMPPVFPVLLAGLYWVCNGDRNVMMAAIILLQLGVLTGTGCLVLALVRQTTVRIRLGVAAAVFVLGFLLEFFLWFQFTHDVWLILLAFDLLLIGFCWCRPLQGAKSVACWGLFGGVCALTNPIVAFTWGVLTFLVALRRNQDLERPDSVAHSPGSGRPWSGLAMAALIAGLTVAPWLVRNYLIFGCFIPVKSNAGYELYQSQYLTDDGLVEVSTFATHPYTSAGAERREYSELGEIAYVQRKSAMFWQSVEADPVNFAQRLARRFLAVTVWYVPFARGEEAKIPGWVWLRRLTYPLPFLAWCWLIIVSFRERLHPAQWIVMGIYAIYFLPYVSISYYDRYAAPLVGVKILLVCWGIERWLLWRLRHESASTERGNTSPGRPFFS